MKIIEALKKVKHNKEKIADLREKIEKYSANFDFESHVYGDEESVKKKLKEFIQACCDLSQENIKLLCAIQRTNLATPVTIEINNKQITKTIAEWVWRRREYADLDCKSWLAFTDRGLKDGVGKNSAGEPLPIRVIRYFDQIQRDEMVSQYRAEKALIDSTLEIINATTDLIEMD